MAEQMREHLVLVRKLPAAVEHRALVERRKGDGVELASRRPSNQSELNMSARHEELPVIGLIPGDCTGIGPEQTARILADGNLAEVARLVVIGDARVLEMGMSHAGAKLNVKRVASPARAIWENGVVPLVDLGNIDPSRFPLGKANAESGKLTGDTLARAIEFAKADRLGVSRREGAAGASRPELLRSRDAVDRYGARGTGNHLGAAKPGSGRSGIRPACSRRRQELGDRHRHLPLSLARPLHQRRRSLLECGEESGSGGSELGAWR
jgi:hypothetical protein